jgi:glycosyltransferase involved in cell wall biosynthesis
VIAISPYIQRHIQENYGLPLDRVPLVNRGVILDAFDPAKIGAERQEKLVRAWGLKTDEPLVLVPGRLSPIKNHDLVIDALAQLKKQKKSVPIVCFVGDDQGRYTYSDSLASHIKKAGLARHVKMTGSCSDMPAALSLASLVLMPSKVPEGFGRVPVEAMAMGVPVIASNLGATQDTVLEGKTGWLLPPDDPARWAEAIDKALNLSPKDREVMAKAARKHVEENFSNRVMIDKTLAVYDTVMKEAARK